MQYQKIIAGDTIIEFHNNWLGEETAIISKCSTQVFPDLRRDDLLVKENIPASFRNAQYGAILNHDMLAYLRMHPAFEGFLQSNFTVYDEKLIAND